MMYTKNQLKIQRQNMNDQNINFAFFGTPEIAVAALDALAAKGLTPNIIVTRPDKPQGRGSIITPTPVKVWAEARNIKVLQPTNIDAEFISLMSTHAWDAFVIVAYGAILPQALLDIPKHGTLNMHPSLLPKLRGPSPITSAVLTNEQPTGISVMLIDEKMDHGPILAQKEIDTPEWPMRAPLLQELLAKEGGELLAETLPEWIAGKITPRAQDDSKATYCAKVKKEDGLLDLSAGATENLRKIRAFEGWPGTYTYFERGGKRIRVAIIGAHISNDGSLAIDIVKPEGKNEMPYADFLNSGALPIDDSI